jgi:hypothetical protein
MGFGNSVNVFLEKLALRSGLFWLGLIRLFTIWLAVLQVQEDRKQATQISGTQKAYMI